MKTFLRGLFIVLIAVALMGVVDTKAEAADMGAFCWTVEHPGFDNGTQHTLKLDTTQHKGQHYSLHGGDVTFDVTVDGSAYLSMPVIKFGVASTFPTSSAPTSTPYSVGAELHPTQLSSDFGTIKLPDGTLLTGVKVKYLPTCP